MCDMKIRVWALKASIRSGFGALGKMISYTETSYILTVVTVAMAYALIGGAALYGSAVILPLVILPLVITSNITGNYLVIKSITR